MNECKRQHKLLYSEYLVINILSYLNAKDLSNACQLNKRFNHLANVFSDYWQRACQDYFCSDYENVRTKEGVNFKQVNLTSNFKQNRISWKTHFEYGILIKQSYNLICCESPAFIEDLTDLRNTLYSGLKGKLFYNKF